MSRTAEPNEPEQFARGADDLVSAPMGAVLVPDIGWIGRRVVVQDLRLEDVASAWDSPARVFRSS